jgi:hypothetical protein
VNGVCHGPGEGDILVHGVQARGVVVRSGFHLADDLVTVSPKHPSVALGALLGVWIPRHMKRAGSRWSDLGAHAILDLRCNLPNGRSLDWVA